MLYHIFLQLLFLHLQKLVWLDFRLYYELWIWIINENDCDEFIDDEIPLNSAKHLHQEGQQFIMIEGMEGGP